jgi:hypothetical protein
MLTIMSSVDDQLSFSVARDTFANRGLPFTMVNKRMTSVQLAQIREQRDHLSRRAPAKQYTKITHRNTACRQGMNFENEVEINLKCPPPRLASFLLRVSERRAVEISD